MDIRFPDKMFFNSVSVGVNGFFTLIGSVVAIILSMMIGFQSVLWIAIAIYLISMLVITRMPGSSFKT